MPESSAPDIPVRRGIYLAFHQLQRGFYPGLTIVSPERCLALLRSLGLTNDVNRQSHPVSQDFEFAVSFDDGYSELAKLLPSWLPFLRVKPLVFIPTDLIGKENRWDYLHSFTKSMHLSVSEIQSLAALGVEFGSHGHSHRPLTSLSKEAVRAELYRSKAMLEEIISRPVTTLAYPYGMTDQRISDTAQEAGYDRAYTMNLPNPDDHLLALGRVPVYSMDTSSSLRAKLPGHPLNFLMRGINTLYRSGATIGSRFNLLTRRS